MLKHIWYETVRVGVRLGLFFLLKKTSVHGKENIPKKGPLLFVANHQNALIDAILIPTTNTKNIHFLTRAGIFKNKKIAKLLSTINMIPVYRIRDGINTIGKNHEVFEQCFEILNEGDCIEIFAEGEHHLERKVVPLKKGFARIILGTLQKYPDLDIQIIPVGINYDSLTKYPSKTSIYYGKPINANEFIDVENPDLKFTKLREVVRNALQKLTLNVEDLENYTEIIQKLEANNVDYLNPFEANKMLKNIDNLPNTTKTKNTKINWLAPIHFIAKLNSIFPLLIWKSLKPKIEDPVYYHTFRFALISTIFPLFYFIQTAIVYYFFDLKYALIYFVSCILLGLISTKTKTITS